MTSERQRLANRANAAASSGPKSAAGKQRAARNALRHGLRTSIYADEGLAAEVETMARRIGGDALRPEFFDIARAVAEAQVGVERVRRCRGRLLFKAMSASRVPPRLGSGIEESAQVSQSEGTGVAGEDMRGVVGEDVTRAVDADVTTMVCELDRLDRYQRRALSRRKSAIRKSDLIGRASDKNERAAPDAFRRVSE